MCCRELRLFCIYICIHENNGYILSESEMVSQPGLAKQ